jgi:hypothetical protein
VPIPANAEAIYTFLTKNGYSDNAAAGIVGNIEQESGGNPEESGGGLIQILGSEGGTLAEQLKAILAYHNQQGAGLISQLNSQGSPQTAALFYSQNFERPDPSLADNSNREQSAEEVAAAAKSGKWPTGPGATGSASSSSNGLPSGTLSLSGVTDAVNAVKPLLHGVAVIIDRAFGMFAPGQGWRVIFGVGALVILLLAVKTYTGASVSVGPVAV